MISFLLNKKESISSDFLNHSVAAQITALLEKPRSPRIESGGFWEGGDNDMH